MLILPVARSSGARLAARGRLATGPDEAKTESVDPAFVLQTAGLMLIAYLAGSIPVGRLVARRPVARIRGPSAADGLGGTNALRALGRKWAAVVVVGDLLKGALPVLLARYVTGDPLVEALCGGAAVAGAIWSVFAGFRSGRGVATGSGRCSSSSRSRCCSRRPSS